jgi:AraC-like DNA-binding protein
VAKERPVLHTTELISVKTLAARWDCSRTTVSRLLDDVGAEPVLFSKWRHGRARDAISRRRIDDNRFALSG